MMQLNHQTRILLATGHVDFRRGIDGFIALCRDELQKDPRCGAYFVFINRGRTMIRALIYDGSGFWLMTKRLSKGRFQGWPGSESHLQQVDAKYLRVLLDGIDPKSLEINRLSRYACAS